MIAAHASNSSGMAWHSCLMINRNNVKLGFLSLQAPALDGFTLTDQDGQTRGTTLSGGVTATRGVHRIRQVGTDSRALAASTQWVIDSDAIVMVTMPLTGSFGLTKSGGGILALDGNQMFTGGIAVNEGIFGFRSRSAQPATGPTVVASGATLAPGLGGSGFFSIADIEQLAANTFPRVNLAADARIGFDTSEESVVYWRVSPASRLFGSNRIYTTSPTIARLSNGDYLIAFNLFGSSMNPSEEVSGTTLLFRSNNKGATWKELPSSPMMDMKRGSIRVTDRSRGGF